MRLICGDCLVELPKLPADSVDSVILDPPAGIGFMGKEWDDFRRARNPADAGRDDVFGRISRTGPEYGRRARDGFIAFLTAALAECLRIAKPGARLLCWAIPRTSHWTGTAIEDAGWLIENRIAHIFGSGFPKGRGQLKPAVEDWWLARKPGGRVPELPGLDGCRVGTEQTKTNGWKCGGEQVYGGGDGIASPGYEAKPHPAGRWPPNLCLSHSEACDGECAPDCPVRLLDEQSGGRHCGGESGYDWGPSNNDNPVHVVQNIKSGVHYGDSGGASRFSPTFEPDPACFVYEAKADRADREAGLERMAKQGAGVGHRATEPGDYLDFVHPVPEDLGEWLRRHRERAGLSIKALCEIVGAHGEVNHGGAITNWELGHNRPTPEHWWKLKEALGFDGRYDEAMTATRSVPRQTFDGKGRPRRANTHPTVKPTPLMRWLCRLITPPGGTVLDCFCGSGSTGKAAILEGFDFIGIDSDPAFVEIARRRLVEATGPLFAQAEGES